MVKYYLVGGAVRDEILGVKNKDIDFAVEASSYEEMREDLLRQKVIIYQERPEYFAIRGGHPTLGGVDYTLCRKEGFYWDNRHPDSVVVGTLMDDLSRRDFTVNAIAKDFETGEIIDPFNGRDDLLDLKLKCVGLTWARFEEDPLRMLRAVRFHIVRGFSLHTEIQTAFMNGILLDSLNTVSVERIYEELRKCFDHNTWKTLMFFDDYYTMKYTIFGYLGLKLEPKVP